MHVTGAAQSLLQARECYSKFVERMRAAYVPGATVVAAVSAPGIRIHVDSCDSWPALGGAHPQPAPVLTAVLFQTCSASSTIAMSVQPSQLPLL